MTRSEGDRVLTDSDIAELIAWRRDLHRRPELSGDERQTAARVAAAMRHAGADRIATGLGGFGVAAIFEGLSRGCTVMLRCELDGLPIQEQGAHDWCSQSAGKGHLCGHDGHMAILAAVARWLGRNRPPRGRAILLVQPAEEDGSGAAKVIADPQFAGLVPDYALSLHNMPGVPQGHALLAEGPMNCASRGMKIALTGRTAHASQPEHGVSPAMALAALVPALTALGSGGQQSDPAFSLVTITHARLGEPAFGIAPGEAELRATLRTQRDEGMARLVAAAERTVGQAAATAGLAHAITWHDVFHHCQNDPEATAILSRALAAEGFVVGSNGLPMRASEDFGRFGGCSRAAMFLLGAGRDIASLHNPDYDFPDDLIEPGARIFIRALSEVLG
ncbi:amidohydrolase [Paracoccus sp. (in: a-proteobacteria)]|uniref:amidohydrolase n=1 Tax=Paracoccus sp. TaxID=267 RepID=UPI004057D024